MLSGCQELVGQARIRLSDKLSIEFITQNLKDACVYLDKS